MGLQKGVIKFIYASYNGIGYPRYRVLVQHKSSSRSTTHDTSPLRSVNVARPRSTDRFLLDPLPPISKMPRFSKWRCTSVITLEFRPRSRRLRFSRLSRDYKFSRKRVIIDAGKKRSARIFENRGGCRGKGGGRGWPFPAVNVLSPGDNGRADCEPVGRKVEPKIKRIGETGLSPAAKRSHSE